DFLDGGAGRVDLIFLRGPGAKKMVQLFERRIVHTGLYKETGDAQAPGGIVAVALHLQVRVLVQEVADFLGIELLRQKVRIPSVTASVDAGVVRGKHARMLGDFRAALPRLDGDGPVPLAIPGCDLPI